MWCSGRAVSVKREETYIQRVVLSTARSIAYCGLVGLVEHVESNIVVRNSPAPGKPSSNIPVNPVSRTEAFM